MRRRLATIIVVAIGSLATASATQGELVQVRNLRVSFDGDFRPHSLPREGLAPITVTIAGKIGTSDGTHPPALRRLEIALNRQGRVSTRGLPSCNSSDLQSTTTQAALALCRPALVGRGSFGASIGLNPGIVPAHGTALVFNSRHAGKPALLLHFYGTVPVRATFVLPLTISRRGRGDFGTVLSATIPKLAGGLGSITELSLKIGRSYNDHGTQRSFASAGCPAPAGFPGAIFSFARAGFYFVQGQKVVSTLTRSCRVR